jgi:hypothetical protein
VVTYTPIFDISSAPYPWRWLAVLLAASLIALPLLTVWVRGRSSKKKITAVVIVPWVLALLAAVVSGLSLYSYWRLSGALTSGRGDVVEGVVAAFSPMPPNGHAEEFFWVAGVRFGYSPVLLAPEFQATAIDGGPIREGLRVRITYFEGKILRLEVASTATNAPSSK